MLLSLLAMKARPQHAAYIVAHQDDELVAMGASILADVAEGRVVHVLLTSRGENSNARTLPALTGPLGYTPTKEEFSEARDREFVECVTRLGGVPLVPPYAARESDGFADVARIINLAKAWIPSGGLLRGHCPTDNHVDHQACSAAMTALAAEGWGQDPRHHLAAFRRISHAPPGVTMIRQVAAGEATEHHAWSYLTQDIPDGWWGVGYISAPAVFDPFLADGASYWHAPLSPPEHALYGTATYDQSVYA